MNTNGISPPLFSVSHSSAHALIAIADAEQIGGVGIDIERCDANAQMQTILDIAFTPREQQGIRATQDPQAALYAQWVSKEAALKALGIGIATDMQSIEILRTPDRTLAVHASVPEWQTLRIADAILDRLMQQNHRLALTGESLRQTAKTPQKKKNKDPS